MKYFVRMGSVQVNHNLIRIWGRMLRKYKMINVSALKDNILGPMGVPISGKMLLILRPIMKLVMKTPTKRIVLWLLLRKLSKKINKKIL